MAFEAFSAFSLEAVNQVLLCSISILRVFNSLSAKYLSGSGGARPLFKARPRQGIIRLINIPNFNQLTVNLTKLCYLKCDNSAIFHNTKFKFSWSFTFAICLLTLRCKGIAPAYYVEKLLPLLVNDCKQLLPSGFILQQDDAPAHMAHLTQD